MAHGTPGSYGTEPTKRELFWPLRRLSLLAAMRRLAFKIRKPRRGIIAQNNRTVRRANPSSLPNGLMLASGVPDFHIRSILGFLRLLMLRVWAARYLP